jgi:iron(III) transport system ATP-binding protein
MQSGVKVQIEQVALSFGSTQVLRGIDIAIEPGEFFALLGPSGCGKSTLLRLIAGFNRAEAGRVLIGGEDVTRVPPWKRNIGMVFQSYALWPHMTVAENVAFGLEERRLPAQEVRAKVSAALELVGLAGLAGRRPGQLSGGQQQRVALARTIAVEPRVLLLDEPLSNLDARLRVHMRRELVALHRKLGVTTIFVTHDQEEAMTTCDRIAVMDQGVIQQVGTPVELFDRPVNRFVAEFVGTINLLPGTLQETVGETVQFVSPSLGTLRLPLAKGMPGNGDASIAFRPHGVILSKHETDASRLWLSGSIREREFMGEFVRYHVRVGDADLIADQPHYLGMADFGRDAVVRLGIDPAQVQVLHG